MNKIWKFICLNLILFILIIKNYFKNKNNKLIKDKILKTII